MPETMDGWVANTQLTNPLPKLQQVPPSNIRDHTITWNISHAYAPHH